MGLLNGPQAILERATEIERGMDLLDAARRGNAKQVEELTQISAPLNYRDPRTGATPLHYVALQCAARLSCADNGRRVRPPDP